MSTKEKELVIEQPTTALKIDFGVKIEALRVVVAADMELKINGVDDESGLVAAKPDKEKLSEYLDKIEAIELPRVGPAAKELRDAVGEGIENTIIRLRVVLG